MILFFVFRLNMCTSKVLNLPLPLGTKGAGGFESYITSEIPNKYIYDAFLMMLFLVAYLFTKFNHGTIIRTGITFRNVIKCFRNFVYKGLLNSACLWSGARLAINKKQKYFSLPDHQLSENQIIVFWFEKNEKKRIKANL